MSTTRTFDADYLHIPPRPARFMRRGAAHRAGQALASALREASVAGIATLAFAWGVAELAFVLLSR